MTGDSSSESEGDGDGDRDRDERVDILHNFAFGSLGEDGKVDADYLDKDMQATVEHMRDRPGHVDQVRLGTRSNPGDSTG